MKKVWKTSRPFRYDLNQIPYNYTVEVTNRFKSLDLIECLKHCGQRFVMLYRRDRVPTPGFLGLPCGSTGKEYACDVGDLVQSLGWEDPPEKGKATHSSVLAWRIPWTIQSMGSQRVRDN